MSCQIVGLRGEKTRSEGNSPSPHRELEDALERMRNNSRQSGSTRYCLFIIFVSSKFVSSSLNPADCHYSGPTACRSDRVHFVE